MKPHLLGELLRLVDHATRPGGHPSAELLAEIRSALVAYEDAEFISLAREANRLDDPSLVGDIVQAVILQPEELAAVSEAWRFSDRRGPGVPEPSPATPPPSSAPAQVIGGRTYRSARGPKTG